MASLKVYIFIEKLLTQVVNTILYYTFHFNKKNTTNLIFLYSPVRKKATPTTNRKLSLYDNMNNNATGINLLAISSTH